MAFLTPDKIITGAVGSETITIKQKITPDGTRATKNICSYVKKGDYVKPNAKLNNGTGIPKGVTVHNTNNITVPSGTNPAEQYARATYPNGNMNGVAVHYWVYKNEIWQQLADNERGWHAADGSSRKSSQRSGQTIGGNLDTIAIEVIETGTDNQTEETAAKLVAYLLNKHGLSPDYDVYTHKYFYPVKTCPVYILPHWNDFAAKVKQYYNAMQTAKVPTPPPVENTPQPTTPINFDGLTVGDIVSFKGGSHYANASAASGSAVNASRAKVTQLYPSGKHPVHLRAVNDAGAFIGGVYGWVDLATIEKNATAPIPTPTPQPTPTAAVVTVGSIVMVKPGAKTYTGGGIASFVFKNKYRVDELKGSRAVLDVKGICTPVNVSDLIIV